MEPTQNTTARAELPGPQDAKAILEDVLAKVQGINLDSFRDSSSKKLDISKTMEILDLLGQIEQCTSRVRDSLRERPKVIPSKSRRSLSRRPVSTKYDILDDDGDYDDEDKTVVHDPTPVQGSGTRDGDHRPSIHLNEVPMRDGNGRGSKCVDSGINSYIGDDEDEDETPQDETAQPDSPPKGLSEFIPTFRPSPPEEFSPLKQAEEYSEQDERNDDPARLT
ncbi:uncharacterized protein LOC106013319 [Aplysia californica]|uniref:Uncharacterized protein LOC106013319 n=1 Tax=Aplysia californica TaxID=6500 RepID=A0ABM1AAU4_APLCA|nr:uncharacterized protein LOC106013319 [Aplysia californica]XP_012944166.1 uncharacterized protein LOC106013319 [Aplysia californica]